MSIAAKDVMSLRKKTGLGMMDCKHALEATDGDMTAAEEWIRAKRKGKRDRRTERTTGEGLIAIVVGGGAAAIVEVLTETDFTARNDEFIAMLDDAMAALEKNNIGQREKEEVLFVLFSMKSDVVLQ